MLFYRPSKLNDYCFACFQVSLSKRIHIVTFFKPVILFLRNSDPVDRSTLWSRIQVKLKCHIFLPLNAYC